LHLAQFSRTVAEISGNEVSSDFMKTLFKNENTSYKALKTNLGKHRGNPQINRKETDIFANG